MSRVRFQVSNYFPHGTMRLADINKQALRSPTVAGHTGSRQASEQIIWVIITAVTNFIFIPCLFHRDVLLKRHLVFETVLSAFTLLSSFMYHLCDSMDWPDSGTNSSFWPGVWLGKGNWHVLDNIGAILCFIVLLIHLTNYKDIVYAQLNKYGFLPSQLSLFIS